MAEVHRSAGNGCPHFILYPNVNMGFVYNPSMRKLIVALGLFLGIALIILSFSELQTILDTLKRGNFYFILLAVAIEVGWFMIMGFTFQAIYRLLGLQESARRLMIVTAAAAFVNIIAPTAGVSGITMFINDGKRRGLATGKVTVAGALFLLADYMAFICILALGLVVLFRRNNLGAGEITASLILVSFAGVLAFLIYLGYRSAEALGNLLARMAHSVNRLLQPILHRSFLSESRAYEFAQEVSDGLSALPENPRSMLYPVLFTLANKTLLMLILISAFLAFDVPFSAGTIIAGFALSYLFLILSPTPSGIGIVEGIMTVALASLGVDYSQAVVITLTYRGITFWLPLGFGALAFRSLNIGVARQVGA